MKYLAVILFSAILAVFQLPAKKRVQDRENLLNQPIGKIKEYSLIYDEYGRSQGYTENAIVSFINKTGKKKQLFNLTIADFYLSDVKLLHLNKNVFIYVATDHTYGHSQGYLYYLNTKSMKTYPVKITSGKNFNFADSLYVNKYFGLTLSDNTTFGSSATIRSRKGNYNGFWEVKYILKQTKPNTFVLQSGKNTLTDSNE